MDFLCWLMTNKSKKSVCDSSKKVDIFCHSEYDKKICFVKGCVKKNLAFFQSIVWRPSRWNFDMKFFPQHHWLICLNARSSKVSNQSGKGALDYKKMRKLTYLFCQLLWGRKIRFLGIDKFLSPKKSFFWLAFWI